MSKYHLSVLLKESVDALVTDVNGIYVDATFGGGGHSIEILRRLSKKGRLIAFDQDLDAKRNKTDDQRFMLIRSNFRYMKNFLRYNKMFPVNGVFADLGISSHQIDTPSRGFSTRFPASLDMRMNKESNLTAEGIINKYPVEKLREIFWQYSDIREARSLARRIVKHREEKKISLTNELTGILKAETDPEREFQFFAKVFQALRIEVNRELDALKEMLTQCTEVIQVKGRLVVISYHSLEDRIVKNFITAGNFSGKAEQDVIFGHEEKGSFIPINKKPVEPSEEEVKKNARARSARLRAAEKVIGW